MGVHLAVALGKNSKHARFVQHYAGRQLLHLLKNGERLFTE